MSSLRSALDELRAEDMSVLSDLQLESDLAEICVTSEMLEAEKLRRLAELDRRRSFGQDGALSASAWLTQRVGMAPSTAREKLRVAKGLEAMPDTQAAFSVGQLSYSHARLLADAAQSHPEAFRREEDRLLASARELPVSQLGRKLDSWRQHLDQEAALVEANARYERRRLRTFRTSAGMVGLAGELDPEGGEALLTALRAIADPFSSEDPPRTSAQRRADALVDLCRRHLENGEMAATGGERPQVVVTVDLESLERRAGRCCQVDQAGVIHPEAARRLACDAGVSRVILAGESQPLEVGRRTRAVPASLRRALVVRDGSCRFPGCDRPHWWCDGHHITHWIDGGPTGLANLVLLCRRHHRLIHEGGFRMEQCGGEVVFSRPDGSRLRAPPG